MSFDLLKDEQDKFSMGRIMLIVHSAFCYIVLTAKVLHWIDLDTEDYAILTTAWVGFLAWAAGPRGLQYLGPAVRAAAGSLRARIQHVDNRFKDDERG